MRSRDVLELAQVGLLVNVRRQLALLLQQGDAIMANFEKVDSALEDLSDEITKIGDQLAAITVENPETQAKLDAVAQKITDAAAKVDALIEDDTETTPPVEPTTT
jgi:ABC-type transporter Mla subunit MlaD